MIALRKRERLTMSKLLSKCLKKNVSAKLAYQEEVNESKFVDKTPPVRESREISEKKFWQTEVKKMDNGIELIVPLDVYRNGDLIEFVNNPDGTVSIMLKKYRKKLVINYKEKNRWSLANGFFSLF